MGRGSTRRWFAAGAAALVVAGVIVAGVDADAQIPIFPTTTTTTAPPQPSTTSTTRPPLAPFETTTTTTAPPSTSPPPPGEAPTTAPPQSAPDPGDPATGDGGGGDGAIVGLVGRVIPPEAQAIMSSIVRTPANNNEALVQGAALLEAAGISRDDALRAVFGRFPILGPTRWSDDWYFPRWTGPRFRFHEGLDMFAPYGTPVVAPVDGIARPATNALGGITVRVIQPDGTYWYFAHLSGIAPGLVDGQPVTTGQLIGFVGTSGNAVGTPPHVHLGLYPQAGAAVPPKPVVDSWVAEGAARVPELLAQLGVAAPAAAPGGGVRRATGTQVGPPTAGASVRGELLWATAVSPAGGAVQLADAAAAAVSERLDWTRRAAEQRAIDLAWTQSSARAAQVLGPLTNPVLRQVVEELRGAAAAGASP